MQPGTLAAEEAKEGRGERHPGLQQLLTTPQPMVLMEAPVRRKEGEELLLPVVVVVARRLAREGEDRQGARARLSHGPLRRHRQTQMQAIQHMLMLPLPRVLPSVVQVRANSLAPQARLQLLRPRGQEEGRCLGAVLQEMQLQQHLLRRGKSQVQVEVPGAAVKAAVQGLQSPLPHPHPLLLLRVWMLQLPLPLQLVPRLAEGEGVAEAVGAAVQRKDVAQQRARGPVESLFSCSFSIHPMGLFFLFLLSLKGALLQPEGSGGQQYRRTPGAALYRVLSVQLPAWST